MIDGGTILVASAAMYGAVSTVTIYATKKIISSAIKGLNGRMDREREDRIKAEGDLWTAANTHGHMGLKGNSAKVTR